MTTAPTNDLVFPKIKFSKKKRYVKFDIKNELLSVFVYIYVD